MVGVEESVALLLVAALEDEELESVLAPPQPTRARVTIAGRMKEDVRIKMRKRTKTERSAC